MSYVTFDTECLPAPYELPYGYWLIIGCDTMSMRYALGDVPLAALECPSRPP